MVWKLFRTISNVNFYRTVSAAKGHITST